MAYLALALNSFALVAIRSFQQLNLMHHRYWWVIPTSYAFTTAEVMLIAAVADYSNLWLTVLSVGTGAWMGCLTAVLVSRRIGH